ncbi:hypothetical protein FB45DRAFT_1055455 [Roridomyces roridus]|uniref:F-box domain-containing protein n=1 Tax=Roridomyces roridus TaxID=1738132 RepID=A0AAD7FS00_9AGAR|nr:hypothetical protein FB45DRAFT_1055455 [Roridomyces roridus]
MLPANVALRSELAELDIDISDLQTRLAEKQAQRGQLQQQLDSITYHVLSLPPEIVSKIFILCLPTWSRPLDSIDLKHAPLLVSHICSQWRRIALSTPALWKDSLDICMCLRRKQATNITETWVARAQSCPLSVKIQGPMDLVKRAGVSEVFRHVALGVQSLELDIFEEDLVKMPEPLEFPLLRKLTMCVCGGDEVELLDDLVQTFDDVPQLSQVVLDHLPAHAIALPWEQLQKFTGKFYLLDKCLDALRFMPNLVECAFSMLETVVAENYEIFSHPHIRTLTLFQSMDFKDEEDAQVDIPRSAQLLAFITLPNLETLELLDIEDCNAEILASFLSRGSPPLKRLVLRPHFDHGQAELLLSTAPLLQPQFTDLEIHFPSKDFVSRFFERFGCDSGFLPGLQKLSVICRKHWSKEASRDDLLDAAALPLASRWDLHGDNKLRVFRAIAVERQRSKRKTPVPLQRLRQEGMDVVIGSRRPRAYGEFCPPEYRDSSSSSEI